MDSERLKNQKMLDLSSRGKGFPIGFNGFGLRIHCMLFYSCSSHEIKNPIPRLQIRFPNGDPGFYGCQAKFARLECRFRKNLPRVRITIRKKMDG
jgi:hypothetical protein